MERGSSVDHAGVEAGEFVGFRPGREVRLRGQEQAERVPQAAEQGLQQEQGGPHRQCRQVARQQGGHGAPGRSAPQGQGTLMWEALVVGYLIPIFVIWLVIHLIFTFRARGR